MPPLHTMPSKEVEKNLRSFILPHSRKACDKRKVNRDVLAQRKEREDEKK